MFFFLFFLEFCCPVSVLIQDYKQVANTGLCDLELVLEQYSTNFHISSGSLSYTQKIFVVKLINTKLRSVSHFHVSVIQQVNFLKILLIIVIFPGMLYGIC